MMSLRSRDHGGRGPRLRLGIRFRRTQPRIYIAGECPGLYPGVHFRREGSSLDLRRPDCAIWP